MELRKMKRPYSERRMGLYDFHYLKLADKFLEELAAPALFGYNCNYR
jgi:hypothetical protein